MSVERFDMIWDMLKVAFGFHSTSFSDLPPILADRYYAAQSRIVAFFKNMEEYTVLCPTVRPLVDAYWTCRDKTGEKATLAEWAVMPQVVTLGDYGVRWESIGGPQVFMVPSSSSARCALVIMAPKELDPDTGWPRLYPSTPDGHDGAEFMVCDIYSDAESALEALVQLRVDWRTMMAAGQEHARLQERHRLHKEGGDGASF